MNGSFFIPKGQVYELGMFQSTGLDTRTTITLVTAPSPLPRTPTTRIIQASNYYIIASSNTSDMVIYIPDSHAHFYRSFARFL